MSEDYGPKWEKVNQDTERLPVPGGWIYCINIEEPIWLLGQDYGPDVVDWKVKKTVCFVPEPKYRKWLGPM